MFYFNLKTFCIAKIKEVVNLKSRLVLFFSLIDDCICKRIDQKYSHTFRQIASILICFIYLAYKISIFENGYFIFVFVGLHVHMCFKENKLAVASTVAKMTTTTMSETCSHTHTHSNSDWRFNPVVQRKLCAMRNQHTKIRSNCLWTEFHHLVLLTWYQALCYEYALCFIWALTFTSLLFYPPPLALGFSLSIFNVNNLYEFIEILRKFVHFWE